MLKKGFSGIALALLALLLQSCRVETESTNQRLFVITGSTMGTTYSVKYFAEKELVVQQEIDELLIGYNAVVSTYVPEASISLFNEGSDSLVLHWDHGGRIFYENLKISQDVYHATEGIYDPTVLPLVNYYGFGSKGRKMPDVLDTFYIQELLKFVGLHKIQFETRGDSFVVKKLYPEVQLDFSAVAKGHGVDALAAYLEGLGLQQYMIEIGGEVRVGKEKPGGIPWSVGLSLPKEGVSGNEFVEILQFSKKSMATSGNYRNFRVSTAGKLAHTLNPKTGFPETNEMLSVTVIAEQCAVADAWATAFMALGKERMETILQDFEWEVLYIYTVESTGEMATGMTPGFNQFLKE